MHDTRIDDVEVFRLAAPVPTPFRWATGALTERTATIVRVTCADGRQGWGEGASHGTPSGAAEIVARALAPMLVGRDARDIEPCWRDMHDLVRPHGVGGMQLEAIAAVDIALWDLHGKRMGAPLVELLGSGPDVRLPTYATGFYYDDSARSRTDGVIAEAQRHLERGFRAMKVKIGGAAEREDLDAVAAVRSEVGPEVELMADANRAYDLRTAARVADALAASDLVWFEEPIDAQHIRQGAALGRRSPLPIATGESETDIHAFARLLDTGSADILQPDVCVAGGITQWRRITALADLHGVRVMPHCWSTVVGLYTTIHLVAALPRPSDPRAPRLATWPGLEYDQTSNDLRTELGSPAPAPRDGLIGVPDGPGLGVEVDEAALERFCVWRWSAKRDG